MAPRSSQKRCVHRAKFLAVQTRYCVFKHLTHPVFSPLQETQTTGTGPLQQRHGNASSRMYFRLDYTETVRKHQCAFTFDNADDLHGAPTSSTLSGTCYVLRRRSHHQDMTKTSFSVDDLDDHPGPSDDHGYRHRRQWPPPVIASPDSSDDLSPSFVRRRPL